MSREQQERPLTVMEIAGHLIRPLTPATPMSGMRQVSLGFLTNDDSCTKYYFRHGLKKYE